MSSIWKAPLPNRKTWYVGSWVSGQDAGDCTADIIIPIDQISGMSSEEIGDYVKSLVGLAKDCHAAEVKREDNLRAAYDVQCKEKQPPAKKNKPGYIYLLKGENTSWYKVGQTNNLRRRIKQLGTKAPFAILHLKSHKVADMDQAESFWHQRFDTKQANGEWFELDPVDVAEFMDWDGIA